MEITIFTGIVLALVGFKLFWDNRQRNDDQDVNHGFSALMDMILYIFAAALVTRGSGEWYVVISFVGYGASVRWLLFDALYNLVRHKKITYRGTVSKLDIFSSKWIPNGLLYMAFKAVIVILFLWLMIEII